MLRIADDSVAESKRQIVHRTRGRHADIPVTDTPWIILHGRVRARLQHLDTVRSKLELVEPARELSTARERLVRDDVTKKSEVRLDTVDTCRRERRLQLFERCRSGVGSGDDLCEHRVVERGNFAAGLDPMIDADRGAKLDVRQCPARGTKAIRGILRVQARLHRMPTPRRTARKIRCIARRRANHPLHEVDARDLLRHAVLDLQARIHLQEVKLLARIVVHEFDRARRAIRNGAAHALRARVKAFAHGIAQPWSWRLFDHLLVAALDRTIAFAERDDLAGAIAEDLHFEVARARDVLLEEQSTLAEAASRESLDGRKTRA